jgi:CBS domain-containing protein
VQVTDVMATTVVSVSPDTELRETARRLIDAEIGAATVVDRDGTLLGVISERDLLRCISEGVQGNTTVSGYMSRDVRTGSPATSIPEAMATMVEGRFRHLPIVNDDRKVIGMVSMRDLMAYTSFRLRGGASLGEDDLDPAELLATIHRMRTGAA